MKVIGFKRSTYTAPDGAAYPGYKVYCSYEDGKVTGMGCDSFFITVTKAAGWCPELGQEIKLEYNRYGKIAGVSVVDA